MQHTPPPLEAVGQLIVSHCHTLHLHRHRLTGSTPLLQHHHHPE